METGTGFATEEPLVLVNGNVITVDAASSVHEAMSVRDGRIESVGGRDRVLGQAGSDARIVDLGGRSVVPGFIDGHTHMTRLGLAGILPDLSGCRSKSDILGRVSEEVARAAKGEWIILGPVGMPPLYDEVGAMLSHDVIPTGLELDQVSSENPVLIKPAPDNRTPLVAVVNSAAMRLLDFDSKPDTQRGITLLRNPDGTRNGIVREDSQSGMLNDPLMQLTVLSGAHRFTIDDRIAAMPMAMKSVHAGGTTSIFEGHGIAADTLRGFVGARQSGEFTMRVNGVLSPPPGESVDDFNRALRDWGAVISGVGLGDDYLRFSGVHLNYFSSEISDELKDRVEIFSNAVPNTGYSDGYVSLFDTAAYREKAHAAARHNVRVVTLAVGEMIRDVLDIWEEVHREYDLRGRRWVLQHLYDVLPDEVARMRSMGILGTGLPTSQFWRGGAPRVNWVAESRRKFAGSYRTMNEQIELSMGTDGAPASPLVSLDAITARVARDGSTICEGEALSLTEALATLTRNGALLSFDEDVKGTLEPKKFADFVILDGDLRDRTPGNYSSMSIEATVVGGRVVHGSIS